MKQAAILLALSSIVLSETQGATINLKDDLIVNSSSSLGYEYQNGGIKFDLANAQSTSSFMASLDTTKVRDFATATSVKFSFEFTQKPSVNLKNVFGMSSLLSSSTFNTQAEYNYAHMENQAPPIIATSSYDKITGTTSGIDRNFQSYTNLIDVEYVMLSPNSFVTNLYSYDWEGVAQKLDSYVTTLNSPVGDLLLNLSFNIKELNPDIKDCGVILKGIQYTPAASVPEPATVSLGLIALGFSICRRNRKR